MSSFSNIIRSAKECDIRLLDKELEDGKDINEEDINLLLNSVIFGTCEKKEYIDFLIKNGIDINQKSGTGNTALHYASMLSDYDLVKKLVESGIDVNATTIKNYNALMEACESDFMYAPTKIREDILPYSSLDEYFYLQTIYNELYLHRNQRKEFHENQLKIIRYLLDNNINKDQVSIDNSSALDLAIENHYIRSTKMVEILSKYGVEASKKHNTSINYFDTLFYGGPIAFVSDLTLNNYKVRKLKAVNKQKQKNN